MDPVAGATGEWFRVAWGRALERADPAAGDLAAGGGAQFGESRLAGIDRMRAARVERAP
jgi:hypothetical protein